MEYLSPNYLIDNVSLNVLGMIPPMSNILSGWVYGIIGLPQQISNSFSLSPMLSNTLDGGVEYLSWLASTYLDIVGLL